MKNHISRFLIEIVIIFIGITLSFLFEEFRDDHKNELAKKEIISALITDVEIKIDEIRNDKKSVLNAIRIIDTCFYLIGQDSFIEKKLATNLAFAISSDHASFSAITPTYQVLSSSGLWQQLPDTLRRKIFNLYNADYPIIQNAFTKCVEYASYAKIHLFPPNQISYFNKTEASMFDLQAKESDYVSQINKALKNPEFRATLLVLRNGLVTITESQNYSLKTQLNLISNLKKYLKEL